MKKYVSLFLTVVFVFAFGLNCFAGYEGKYEADTNSSATSADFDFDLNSAYLSVIEGIPTGKCDVKGEFNGELNTKIKTLINKLFNILSVKKIHYHSFLVRF